MSPALQFAVLTAAGWLNRRQQDQIDYLREENRILREQLGDRHDPALVPPADREEVRRECPEGAWATQYTVRDRGVGGQNGVNAGVIPVRVAG
jgi:hypothetical protein